MASHTICFTNENFDDRAAELLQQKRSTAYKAATTDKDADNANIDNDKEKASKSAQPD